MNVGIAMSGGVDSSVAAALLKQEGQRVTGITMLLRRDGGDRGTADAAREVADHLGIEHVTVALSEQFTGDIVGDFCREYARGRTPNPCVRCNRLIKFGVLAEKARELGLERIATGHYARLEGTWDGGVLLRTARDTRKDQSYFICRLTREQLKKAMFPIGHLTKHRVRELASEMGLPVAGRPESQEICFIPDGDYAGFVQNHLGIEPSPGPVRDSAGNILGQHKGILHYTIGQRRGLGIAAPSPLYVTAIDAGHNTVIVGTEEDVRGSDLTAGDMNWLTPDIPEEPFRALARIRYRAKAVEASIVPLLDNKIYVNFSEPQKAITPGQTIALYRRDTVIGGGIIERQGR